MKTQPYAWRRGTAAVVGLLGVFLAVPGFASVPEVWVDDDFNSGTPGWGVTHFAVIQDGINAVEPAGTIHVAAGTYVEQLNIGKSLDLLGAGASAVTVKAPATLTGYVISGVPGTSYPVVYAHDAAAVNIQGVTVDGDGRGNGHLEFFGFAFANAGGSVKQCSIKSVRETPLSGTQNGVGVGVYNADATARSFTLEACRLYDIQLLGAEIKGPNLTIAIRENLFTGAGPTPVVVQSGVQVSSGVTGVIEANDLTGYYYTGPDWSAACALMSFGDNMSLLRNVVNLCNQGVYLWNDSTAVLRENAFAGNDFALLSDSTGVVDATQNWWGKPSGPRNITGPGTIFAGDGDAVQEFQPPNFNISSPLSKPAQPNVVYLEPKDASVYVKPSETVQVDLKVANLQQPVNGLQALLNFSSTYFRAGPSDVVVTAGGGDWDELIYSAWTTGGDLDVAVGVDLFLVGGTQADATTATFTLTPTGTEGVTTMVFRSDEQGGYSTMLSDTNHQPVWPVKVNTTNIWIDGTQPALSALTATQNGGNVLNCAAKTVQGTVDISVNAADTLSGLAAVPSVTLTNGSTVENAVFVSETPDGRFLYTWAVSSATLNGTWTLDVAVADKAGNTASTSGTLCVNKNQITGQVELDGFTGTGVSHRRAVTFVATGGTPKSWTLTLVNTTGSVFDYTLTDVPTGTTALSAKTAWNLRSKMPAVLDGDGQAANVNFLGDDRLLAGDLNGDNVTNILDFSILRAAWNSANPAADLNGDGQVQTLDYSLMKSNWFRAGDPQ